MWPPPGGATRKEEAIGRTRRPVDAARALPDPRGPVRPVLRVCERSARHPHRGVRRSPPTLPWGAGGSGRSRRHTAEAREPSTARARQPGAHTGRRGRRRPGPPRRRTSGRPPRRRSYAPPACRACVALVTGVLGRGRSFREVNGPRADCIARSGRRDRREAVPTEAASVFAPTPHPQPGDGPIPPSGPGPHRRPPAAGRRREGTGRGGRSGHSGVPHAGGQGGGDGEGRTFRTLRGSPCRRPGA